MGTTLTGTTPQDTYDSLIKVTDNGPIGATPKYLSDGLGTDSSLALSTKNVLIGTTTAVVNFGRELTVDATALASEPEAFLALKGNRVSGNIAAVPFYNGAEQVGSIVMQAEGNMRLLTGTTTANTSEKVRITAAGDVGIGTSTPAAKLQAIGDISATNGVLNTNANSRNVNLHPNADFGNGENPTIQVTTNHSLQFATNNTLRASVTANGLCFGSDTAAANALDDYEEGTWTMGIAFDGASVGVTYSLNTGTYTKIGRQVTVNGVIVLTSKGSSTGSASVTGLPFTIANTTSNYASASLRLKTIAFTNQFQGFGEVNTTKITLEDISALGTITDLANTNFADNSQVMLNYTYFV
jgi:hypothetical protein